MDNVGYTRCTHGKASWQPIWKNERPRRRNRLRFLSTELRIALIPGDGIEQLRAFDAVYLGAVGFPTVADHVSLWGLLIPIRREFDLYINLRPVRLFDGVPSPLAGKAPGDIDFYVVRENVEGEYSAIGGMQY